MGKNLGLTPFPLCRFLNTLYWKRRADFFTWNASTDATQSSYCPWVNYGATTPTV